MSAHEMEYDKQIHFNRHWGQSGKGFEEYVQIFID